MCIRDSKEPATDKLNSQQDSAKICNMLDTINTMNDSTNYTSEDSPEVKDPNFSEINQSDSEDTSPIDFKHQDSINSEKVIIQSPDLELVSSPKSKSLKRKNRAFYRLFYPLQVHHKQRELRCMILIQASSKVKKEEGNF